VIKGDSLSYHLGMKFSTEDRDNDKYSYGNCAQIEKGGWWFKSCSHSNLNGHYFNGGNTNGKTSGITWASFGKGPNYSMKSVVMKIRPYYPRPIPIF